MTKAYSAIFVENSIIKKIILPISGKEKLFSGYFILEI